MESQYIYFLLLILISLSNEEFLKSRNKNRSHNSVRRVKRRQNYEIIDENEPLAQIDVSSFIQSPDENPAEEQYADLIDKSREALIDIGIDDAPVKTMDLVKTQDYENLKSEIPELNTYKDKNMYPQHANVNELPDTYNKENSKNHKYNSDKIRNDLSFQTSGHSSHTGKKCFLKNMKIPFFSRSKIETTKTKKNKKRKFSFRNPKKHNPSVTKVPESHLNSNSMQMSSTKAQNLKIKKRSYFDRLCPACKQKVLKANLVEDKYYRTTNKVIHNNRQYFQNMNEESENVDVKRFDTFGMKHDNDYGKKQLNNIKDLRWKRDNFIDRRDGMLKTEAEQFTNFT